MKIDKLSIALSFVQINKRDWSHAIKNACSVEKLASFFMLQAQAININELIEIFGQPIKASDRLSYDTKHFMKFVFSKSIRKNAFATLVVENQLPIFFEDDFEKLVPGVLLGHENRNQFLSLLKDAEKALTIQVGDKIINTQIHNTNIPQHSGNIPLECDGSDNLKAIINTEENNSTEGAITKVGKIGAQLIKAQTSKLKNTSQQQELYSELNSSVEILSNKVNSLERKNTYLEGEVKHWRELFEIVKTECSLLREESKDLIVQNIEQKQQQTKIKNANNLALQIAIVYNQKSYSFKSIKTMYKNLRSIFGERISIKKMEIKARLISELQISTQRMCELLDLIFIDPQKIDQQDYIEKTKVHFHSIDSEFGEIVEIYKQYKLTIKKINTLNDIAAKTRILKLKTKIKTKA